MWRVTCCHRSGLLGDVKGFLSLNWNKSISWLAEHRLMMLNGCLATGLKPMKTDESKTLYVLLNPAERQTIHGFKDSSTCLHVFLSWTSCQCPEVGVCEQKSVSRTPGQQEISGNGLTMPLLQRPGVTIRMNGVRL